MIRIVTDSTCDLPEGQLQALGVTVVPVNIHFGTEEYHEGEDLSYDDFFRLVEERHEVPKTSQPSPGRFEQTYRQLAAEGATTILSLHVTGKLSGTVQSATIAAEKVKDAVDVRVFDTLAGSAGSGFMVLEAVDLLQQGADADAVLARWAEIRDHLRIFFMLDTLKYARMSGRVGAIQSSLAALLQVKPIVVLNQGVLELGERVRTRRAAIERMLELTRAAFGDKPLNVAVVHALAPDAAESFLAEVQAQFSCRRTFVARLAASLVAHLGPGTLGIVAYPA
ncbi:MAG: DegV family protein [Caldilineales bacterium]|nr:DegV family protein [Caldilineales bacterium]MDW8318390.1 DegV family protein [Anaerolineae bacterium]